MFKFWKPKEQGPKCTCGSWPDPSWTNEMFLKKFEASKLCPVHKNSGVVMVVHKAEVPPQIAATVPVQPAPNGAVESPFHHIAASADEVLLSPGDLGRELRNARIHLLNCTNLVPARAELWADLNEIIEALEEIIEENK